MTKKTVNNKIGKMDGWEFVNSAKLISTNYGQLCESAYEIWGQF